MISPILTTSKTPLRPTRQREVYRVRILAALGAGAAAAVAMLLVYYATLGLLPSATSYPTTLLPVAAWAHRFDLAQFFGTMVLPPRPSLASWIVGVVMLGGIYTGVALVYAVLLTWTEQHSDAKKGIGIGIGLGVVTILQLFIANGFHPAIMRNALPDTGLLMLGWSSLAPLQILLVHMVYGAVLGKLYEYPK